MSKPITHQPQLEADPAGLAPKPTIETATYEAEANPVLTSASEADATKPRTIEVTIITPGVSNNGWDYSEAVLRQSAHMFEAAPAFCDHPGPSDYGRAGGRSLRDLIGVYEGVRYDQGIKATLRLYPGGEWLYPVIEAAIKDRAEGRAAPNIGVSADMLLAWEPVMEQRQDRCPRVIARRVLEIRRVNSADIVVRPAAGGRLDRIAEADNIGQSTAQEVEPLANETRTATTATAETTPPTSPATESAAREAQAAIEAAHEARKLACAELLNAKLRASSLPEPAQATIRARYEGQIFEATALDQDVEAMTKMLADVFAQQTIKGVGAARESIRTGATSLEKIQMAVDRLFGLDVSDPSVPRLSGIREAYVLITGDPMIEGRVYPEASALEADEVTTSVMANIVGISMNKRLVADYKAQPKWWLPIVVRVPLRDMKVQTRIMLNDFAPFATVAENGPYVNLPWDDSAETYTPAKKGNLVTVTLETIINDDLRAVSRIPSKLASAANLTINEFVSGLFTANSGAGPAMADTYEVFDALHHQGNCGTSELSQPALQVALTSMLKYVNAAGSRIGVQGRYLLVPPDLAFEAAVILGSTLLPGSPNNDINPLKGVLEPIVVPNWTDTNNWYVLADPRQLEAIEIGFLNGREEPELLTQTAPDAGAVFTNDALAYKVRWIFGGGWLDFRGAFGSVVA